MICFNQKFTYGTGSNFGKYLNAIEKVLHCGQGTEPIHFVNNVQYMVTYKWHILCVKTPMDLNMW